MVGPCALKPLPKVYQKIFVENLTVVRPPMLKIYFWESFDITSLNQKLKSNTRELEHNINVPTCQMNSPALKFIFWLRNLTDKSLEIKLKRIKNCTCVPMETRVGFNQFRQLYHCPHRRLIYIAQELLCMQPNELLPLSITAYSFLYGEHILSYELQFSDERLLKLNFNLNINTFDPDKCVLTKELIPINIRKLERIAQPIWVQNITMTQLNFSFVSRDRNLKLLNPNLTVPRQSVWPLMVEYQPTDYTNELELMFSYENVQTSHKILSQGVLNVEPELTDMPLKEKECADYPYVIYPNRLDYVLCLMEQRTQIVNVHNYGQKCMEFRWQNYIINDFFSVTFEPTNFTLKGHHSKICLIKVKTFDRILHFRRIPLVLEVHRILDRATLIAKAELSEIESIDDPKWKEGSYMEHVFLHLNIKVDKSILDDDETEAEVIEIAGGNCSQINNDINQQQTEKTEEQLKAETIRRLGVKPKLTANEVIELSMAIDQRLTIFEKLFWKYLSKSDFMLIRQKRTRQLPEKSYDMIVNDVPAAPKEEIPSFDRNRILEILSRLMLESITDLAKNWLFIPPQYYNHMS